VEVGIQILAPQRSRGVRNAWKAIDDESTLFSFYNDIRVIQPFNRIDVADVDGSHKRMPQLIATI